MSYPGVFGFDMGKLHRFEGWNAKTCPTCQGGAPIIYRDGLLACDWCRHDYTTERDRLNPDMWMPASYNNHRRWYFYKYATEEEMAGEFSESEVDYILNHHDELYGRLFFHTREGRIVMLSRVE